MNVLARLGLFLSSYSPLFGIFALLTTFGHGWPVYVCLVLMLVGFIATFAIPVVSGRMTGQTLRINAVQVRDSDALSYVVTYIVPLGSLAATTGRQQAAIVIFMALIAVLYVRAGLFYVNPLLALLGYRIYQVATPSGVSATLLCRRTFVPTESQVSACRIGEYVYVEERSARRTHPQ